MQGFSESKSNWNVRRSSLIQLATLRISLSRVSEPPGNSALQGPMGEHVGSLAQPV